MKSTKNFLVAAIAVVALYGTPGFAADIPVKAPAYAPLPAYNWTGFYVGGHAGYARGDTDWTFSDTFWNSDVGDQLNINDRSWLAGAHIGFNYQINSFVVGLEGTWSATGLKERVVSPFFPDSDHEETKIKNVYTIAARAGVAFNQFLLYGKGGWAGGQVELSADDSSRPTFWNPGKENHSGWVAGLGLEYMLTPNFILGVEYNRIDLGSETFSANNTGGSTLLTEVSADTKVDSVVGRISYKFGSF